jgi:hypothetical protein
LVQADSAGLQAWYPDPYFQSASELDGHGHITTASAVPKWDPATASSLATENETLKAERNNLKRRNILWIAGLVALIIIILAVGGGLAGKFLHQDKNAAQTSPGGTLASQIAGGTVWAKSSFVTLVSTAGGSAVYSTITTSEPITTNSAANAVAATTVIAVPPIQGNWRYCWNCHAMFYNGYATSGVCLFGGGHVAQGYMFDLPHDIAPAASTQDQWRYCTKCFVMFYNGDTNKGTCAAGGAHQAAGFVFVLSHDVPSTLNMQDQWRYCNKCRTMFFDGYSDKGLCPGGGGHVADGFDFVLPHDLYGN